MTGAGVRGVLLATFALMPDGEPGGELLISALAARGIEARWAIWDDPTVNWAAADLVAVRATWDYHRRCAEFLEWARAVERDTLLLNGAEVFAWNADKAYLTELGDVPVVPTALLDDSNLVPGLLAALDRWGTVVIKPRTGAGGIGVVIAEGMSDYRLASLAAAPWVVQPLVDSVRTTGEISVYVLAGRAISQVDKLPGGDEIRVQEFHGGRSLPGRLVPETIELAEATVAVVRARFNADLAYARVDLMSYDDRLVVSEIELIEPGLYLDVLPDNAAPFADLVAARVSPAGR